MGQNALSQLLPASFERLSGGAAVVAVALGGQVLLEWPLETFQGITHPDDLDADLAYLEKMLGGEIETYSMAKGYCRKSGESVWIELTVGLVRTPSGEPGYFIAVVADISARQRAEESLRRRRPRAAHDRPEARGQRPGAPAWPGTPVFAGVSSLGQRLGDRRRQRQPACDRPAGGEEEAVRKRA